MKNVFRFARRICKKTVRSLPVPKVWQEKVLFYLKLGYWPDFSQPRSLSEKLHFRKMYETDRRLVELSDKITVRDYVRQSIGEKYLIPLLHTGESLNTKQLESIGDNVVIKRNDDSGSSIVIRINSPEVAASVARQINEPGDYGAATNEWWYREIESKVMVERFLDDGSGHLPIDYKFFVFDTSEGKYFFVEVIRRRPDGQVECGLFEADLTRVCRNGRPVTCKGCLPFSGGFPAADTFQEMKAVALKLCDDFNFIRVDLYSVGGKVYFGELTFCPSEGRKGYDPVSFDFDMGRKWEKPVLLKDLIDPAKFKKAVGNYRSNGSEFGVKTHLN